MQYALLILTLFMFASCSYNSGASDTQSVTVATGTSTIQQQDPYTIGTVDTAFKLIWPDHKIEVGGVPDPKVSGVTCFYSRARTGGISGAIWFAEDTSDASVACRQTGKITFLEPIRSSEEIWNESTNFFFKKIRIVRFYDKASNSLIYLVYSDKLIDGSPKNSISAVALDSIVPSLR